MSLRHSLTARMLALGGAIAVMVGVAIAALLLTIGNLRETSRNAERSQTVLISANRAEKLLLDLETGVRGFRLTREDRFLEPWRNARLLLPVELERLVALSADNPPQAALAQQIATAARSYLEDYAVAVVEDVRAGRETIPTAEGKRQVDAIRAQLARFDAREERLSADRTAAADDAGALATAMGIGVLVVGVALLVAFAVYLSRTVAGPVRQAAQAAQRMARGDLSVRVPVRGHDELAQLGTSFNTMGEALQESHDELDRQNAELEAQTAELEAQQEQLGEANDELRAQRDELGQTTRTLAEETERQHLFNEFAKELAARPGLADRAAATLRTLAEAAGGEVGVLYGGAEDGYEVLDTRGVDAADLPRRIGRGDGLAGRAIAECRTVAAARGEETLRLRAFGRETTVRHELHVALSDGKNVVGVVSLGRSDEAGFSERERELAEMLGGQGALALNNAFTTRRAQRLADVNRAVLDTVQDAIILTDRDGRVVLANAPASRLAREVFGVSVARAAELEAVALAGRMTDPEGFLAAQAAIAEDPDEPTFDEFEVAETGRVFQRYTAPVVDATDARLGRAMVVREATAEREAERTKNDLMSTVSHELRTPLASIVGFTELLLTRETDPEMQRSHLDTVHREARRLASLIDDFLDLQRIAERGRLPLERRRVDLRPLVSDQAKVFAAHSRAHTLDVHLPDSPLVTEADPDRVRQVLANLLSNAIKYSPDGGRIDVDGWAGNGKVGVAVLDSGVGIPNAEQPRIFERFYRAGSATERAIGGTGLGLALAREIVEAHDGRIGFESVEGQGSRFWFELPAAS